MYVHFTSVRLKAPSEIPTIEQDQTPEGDTAACFEA
jgi:hypothetical protein